jgi:hypothetical protein
MIATRKSIKKKDETSAQFKSRKINQVNFCLCGVRENLRTQHSRLVSCGMHSTAYHLSKEIDNIVLIIEHLAQERKSN